MAEQFKLDAGRLLIGEGGLALPNGRIHFYDRKTGQYAQVFGDARATVPLLQPVQANASAMLPPIYLDSSTDYRAVVTDAQNNQVREISDVRQPSEGVRLLNGIDELKAFGGHDALVMVVQSGGCPSFYRQIIGCGSKPDEHLPDVVHADNCTVWQICDTAPNICAAETAKLNCDFHVLVQECAPSADSAPTADSPPSDCGCKNDETGPPAPKIKKASIGAVLNAAAKCLPRVCIPHDAPEFALVGDAMVYGDRLPPPIFQTSGSLSNCIRVAVGTQADTIARHLRLDTIVDLSGAPVRYARINLTNNGQCRRRYELRAINRLNRARDSSAANPNFTGVPMVDANFQTRFGRETDPLLNAVYGVADFGSVLPWLTELSIADSTMGPFMSGYLGSAAADTHPNRSTNGYTENTLIVDLNPGDSVWYALKYHVFWDMNASAAALSINERIHFGTKILARQI